MNKNLKKVISSVAALSMVASSVAALAATFPDVESDASYAQAVQELSALNVINGYEDGTFKPENLVTRAEITKMIVDALAEGNSAAASKGTQSFDDVAAGADGHWANGYINQGVGDGWIAGMGDGTFAPDANVTYVQAQKMLVAAVGYDIYAQAKGGWPAGYKLYANQLDITSGVEGVESDDQQLTRAQVAKMIDNAMDAPLCVIKEWETQWNGSQTPVLEVKDGEGKGYQTLFTDKHDAYKVYGRVTATSKSGTGLDADEVSFQIEKADNFDDEYIKATDDPTMIDAYVGDSNADKYLTVYAQALIQIDEDDEYTILSISPAAANKSVTVLSEDVDESKSDLSKNVLYFFPAGQTRGSVKYNLADEVEWYLNGIKQSGSFDEEALNNYIIDNDTTTVTLQKTTKNGSTSTASNYDTIMITSYTTAVVEQVIDKSNETRINFKEQATGTKTNMILDKDDEQKKYTFTMNGEAIDPTELEENDVLSISYDEASFADSNFYDVIVSRDVKDGLKCTSAINKDNEVTLGGTKYKVSHGMDNVEFETSTTYTIYLDAFGRIAYTDEDATTKKIGILKSVYQKSNGDWVADLITKDGQELTEVKVDDENGQNYKDLLATEGTKADKYPQQVVDYKLSSANKLTINKVLNAKYAGSDETSDPTGEYKENSSKIGNVRVSDSTIILDLSDINEKDTFKTMSVSDLNDGVDYDAYGYDKSTSDSSYRFVIITAGMDEFDSTHQLAIFLEAGEDVNEDDDTVKTMTVVEAGEQKTVTIDEDYDAVDPAEDLSEGDVIIYKEKAGYVNGIIKVTNKGTMTNADDYADFRDAILSGDGVNSILASETIGVDPDLTDADEDEVAVKFGVLVKNNKATVFVPHDQIGSDENGFYVDFSNNDNIDLATSSDTKVYTYNFDNGTKNFGRIVLDDALMTTSSVSAAYAKDEEGDKTDKYYIYDDDNDVKDEIVFAVIRTFNGDEAQEIYQIVAE